MKKYHAHLEVDEGRRLVHGCLQSLGRNRPQAVERISRIRAARISDDLVVVGLDVWIVDRARRDQSARLHECGAEETFGVAAVGLHLQRDGHRACTLTPAGSTVFRESLSKYADSGEGVVEYYSQHDLLWVSTEC